MPALNRNDRARRCLASIAALAPFLPFYAPASLATAANAVDHAVERRVLPVDWIVRSHQVFLRGHLVSTWLAVSHRCLRQQLLVRVRRWRCGWIWRTSRLRNRHRSVDQGQQRYRRDQLSHDGSPELGPLMIM